LQAQQTIELVKKVPCTISVSAIEREPTERCEYWTNRTRPWQRVGVVACCEEDKHHNSHQYGDSPWSWCVVLCVVWHRPGESRHRDCDIAVSEMVLVNDLVCCGLNIGRQFLLMADIYAMIVVFINVCKRW
jgi:hypothetical protein